MVKVATFAGGCFWCTEAIFQRLKGVSKVVSGYANSKVSNPTYEDVSSGISGASEAIQITFDPEKISFSDLLEVFFKTHDPTTLNRQGADVGEQYRSAVYYHDSEQKDAANLYITKLTKSEEYKNPIVTEVSEFTSFTESEDYHKNYYNNNKTAGYCRLVIDPKINKLMKDFSGKVKEEYK